jgi:hypothetical protein
VERADAFSKAAAQYLEGSGLIYQKLAKDPGFRKQIIAELKPELYFIPVGAVLAYAGPVEAAPSEPDVLYVKGNRNWVVCNGATIRAPDTVSKMLDADTDRPGTQVPNLRDRFVKGAVRSIFVRGGANARSHSCRLAVGGGPRLRANIGNQFGHVSIVDSGILDSVQVRTSSDEEEYNNAPAFLSLYYIIRVK